MALPVAMGLLGVTLILAATAASQAGGAGDSADRDRQVKRSLQAADAGLRAARYRMNMFDVTRISAGSPQCVQPDASGSLTLAAYAADGWCPPVTEDLGTGASYSYRVSAPTTTGNDSVRTVVSVGTAGEVSRRVATRMYAELGTPLFGNKAVRSHETLQLDSNAKIGTSTAPAHVESNGDITLGSNAKICGNATPGPGETVQPPSGVCTGYSTTPAATPFVLPPPDQGNARTVNDNYRICATSGANRDPCTGGPSWNATTRALTLDSEATLTLTGNVYSFCRLRLDSNAQLIIAARDASNPVRIYIDYREDCPGASSSTVMEVNSNAYIRNLNSDPRTLQIYVMGSRAQPQVSTNVQFDSNATVSTPMALYAPGTRVDMDSNARILGAIAAKKVTMNSNAEIHYSSLLSNLQGGVTTRYGVDQYRECHPRLAAGDAPDARC